MAQAQGPLGPRRARQLGAGKQSRRFALNLPKAPAVTIMGYDGEQFLLRADPERVLGSVCHHIFA